MNKKFSTAVMISIVLAIVAWAVFSFVINATPVASSLFVLISGIAVAMFATNNEQASQNLSAASDSITTLYVGNLPYKANEQAVSDFFSDHAKVQSVRLMRDKRTGKRKGYGFVELSTNNADALIQKLNDSEFQERTLKVRLANNKNSD